MGERRRLPSTRRSITHKGTIHSQPVCLACPSCGEKVDVSEGDIDMYIIVGLFDDGTPGEIFVKVAKHGDTVKGLIGQWAIAVSIALQNQVNLAQIVSRGVHSRFEPSGMTDNPKIRMAKSISDYICRWLELTFLSEQVEQPV